MIPSRLRSDPRVARSGLLAHAASVDRELRGAAAVLCCGKLGAEIVDALFGPEHGFSGRGARHGWSRQHMRSPEIPIYSLYGDDPARPQPRSLRGFDGLDAIVIDLQDVGSRYYTYVWTAASDAQGCGDPPSGRRSWCSIDPTLSVVRASRALHSEKVISRSWGCIRWRCVTV